MCMACFADRCSKKEEYRYVNEFDKADKSIPPSTYTEKVITGLALGVITAGCSPLSHFFHVSACVIVNAPCKATQIKACPEGLFSTGLYRDCTVLRRTFKDRNELLPTYEVNRGLSRSISSDTDSIQIDFSMTPDNVFSPNGVFRPVSENSTGSSFATGSSILSPQIVVPRSILKVGGKNYVPKNE